MVLVKDVRKPLFLMPGFLCTLLGGVLVAFFAFGYTYAILEKNAQQSFDKVTTECRGQISRACNQYVMICRSVKQFFECSNFVTRDEFSDFVSILLSDTKGLKTLFWAPRIPIASRVCKEYQIYTDELKLLQMAQAVEDTQQNSDVYIPISYIEPAVRNQSSFGVNLATDPDFAAAFEKTNQTGNPATVVQFFPLVPAEQSGKSEKDCWLIFPVFEKQEVSFPETGQRRGVTGYLVGVVDFERMLKDLFDNDILAKLEFNVDDVTFQTQSKRERRLDKKVSIVEMSYANCDLIELVDRIWKLEISPKTDVFMVTGTHIWPAWTVFAGCLLLTGLLLLHQSNLYRHNENAHSLVERRTCELQDERQKADRVVREAYQANRLKSKFLASMSHDIRTPMNAILGFSELLSEEPLSKEQKSYVDMIRDNSKALLMLLNDILDLSKIEAGKIHIDIMECDIVAMLSSIDRMFRATAESRGIEFKVFRDPRVATIIPTDELRVRQCLVNLVGNAIKFTHAGHIHVHLCQNDGYLRFNVEDTGIGISQDRLDSIFDNFTQTKVNISHEYGGSGLGLTIARQLARLLGGDITVSSREGKGSVFSLRLPLKVCAQSLSGDHAFELAVTGKA
jgi:signal transduction histidine kinase